MAQSPMVKVEVIERTDRYVVAVWRRLMLLVWRGEANAAGVERFRAIFEPWANWQPGGAAFLIVVPNQSMAPPDEQTRAAMERTTSAPGGAFKGMAMLIEADGFVAATVRSVMVRLSSRRTRGTVPNFFRTVADSANWAAALLRDRELTPAGLEEAIRLARKV